MILPFFGFGGGCGGGCGLFGIDGASLERSALRLLARRQLWAGRHVEIEQAINPKSVEVSGFPHFAKQMPQVCTAGVAICEWFLFTAGRDE